MSSVTSCVGGGLFICFTCLHVPYSTVTSITCFATLVVTLQQPGIKSLDSSANASWRATSRGLTINLRHAPGCCQLAMPPTCVSGRLAQVAQHIITVHVGQPASSPQAQPQHVMRLPGCANRQLRQQTPTLQAGVHPWQQQASQKMVWVRV
jgi:hypothetical protein